MNKDDIFSAKICPYCNCETKLVTGEVIYPKMVNTVPRPNYLDKKFYVCTKNPDHYVGTYNDNKTSLGRLADSELRKMKMNAHAAFDPLWKKGDKRIFPSRHKAYNWLSEKMNLPLEYTHFGMFTIEQCKEAIKYCNEIAK